MWCPVILTLPSCSHFCNCAQRFNNVSIDSFHFINLEKLVINFFNRNIKFMNSFMTCSSYWDHISGKANFFKLNVQVTDNSIYLLCIYDLQDYVFNIKNKLSCKHTFFNLLFNFSWYRLLYYFQVCNLMIRYLYTLWSDHPDKSGTHITPYIVKLWMYV